MNCLFCQKELTPGWVVMNDDDAAADDSFKKKMEKLYNECTCCGVGYRIDMSAETIMWYEFYILYNENEYAAWFCKSENRFSLSSIGEDGQEVLEMEYTPHITPQNLAQKIPTLLTFS